MMDKKLMLKYRSSIYSILNIVALYLFISSIKLDDLGANYFFTINLTASISILMGALFQSINRRILDFLTILFIIAAFFSFHFALLMISAFIGLNTSRSLAEIINRTRFDNRGFNSAIVVFIIYLIIIISFIFIRNFYDVLLLLFVLKLLSFIIDTKNNEVYEDYVRSRLLVKISFLVIWFVFIFIDTFSTHILLTLGGATSIIHNISILISLIFMIIGGYYIDRFGRKTLLLFSYVYLGVIYAFVSITEFIEIVVLEGLVWGILTLLFLMVIWGDLCSSKERPIFIALSLAIVLIDRMIMVVIPPIITIQQLFSFISLFLFLSAFIILILPETLPESLKKRRELCSYIKKAKKIKEEY